MTTKVLQFDHGVVKTPDGKIGLYFDDDWCNREHCHKGKVKIEGSVDVELHKYSELKPVKDGAK